MGINERYFNAAMEKLNKRRSDNGIITDMRRSEVYEKIPEYGDLAEKLAETGHKLVMLVMQKSGGEVSDGVSQLEQENRDTRRRMAELLKNAGYPEDYLEPVYTCPKCKDKGTVGGKWCGCFQRLMLDEAARELNENSPLELSTFESFKTEYYPELINPEMHVSEHTIMERNLSYCKDYAKDFTPDSCGILMSGATGLGKTHLSLAIAAAVIEKGYSVIYGSAPEILRILEREYFGKSDNDTMSALNGCDLLILDDLGAEMEKPLYSSLLYEMVNSRVSRSRPMIVSTNYSTNELLKHYQDKLCSRLLSFHVMMFYGSDIRRKLKKK